ncbi:putative ribosome biogenesis protein bms1 protein [Rosellinia necatrix]|uniref:Putative ribosome biogenesis protein bms1 protein n=1 Tax=Rosellinia necatrix TaxID=77044 RepID=A0A1W2TX37_ROSNE|nr:putative ribosome biogenesis protein bms1 protein [Rosellinia necatrix]
MEEQAHKPHRKAKEKKKPQGDHNPKAFAFSRPGKLARAAARSHDIREKRLHVPQADRTPDAEPPPRLVTIVGPPGVGKTTLLKSLVKRYTKETISDPTGPVTVVTSRKQRLTFVECPAKLTAMVDIAKIADVVILLIDGNFGFEMEIMEFLNILSATGMPGNVFSVLTHLDLFRKPQHLKDAKKTLKHRLWSELYQGAHLFYLSGVINGRYPDREVHNLSRFISVMKNPRPLVWKNSHSYILGDSLRDLTHPNQIEEDAKCDRSVAIYGYLRGGVNFSVDNQKVHIPGVGDFVVKRCEALPDPCPSPAQQAAVAKATGQTGRKRLDEKDKKLHAPFSDRQGLKIEGSAIWINREKGFNFDKDAPADSERGLGEEMIIGLQSGGRVLGQTENGLQLFSSGDHVINQLDDAVEDSGRKSQRAVRAMDQDNTFENGNDDEFEGLSGDDEFVSGDENEELDLGKRKLGRLFQDQDTDHPGDDLEFADSDSDLGSDLGSAAEGDEDEEEDDDDDELAAKWRADLVERAKNLQRQTPSYRTADLARLMYDEQLTAREVLERWKAEVAEDEEEDIEADSEDEFFNSKNEDDNYVESTPVPQLTSDDYDQLAAKWSLDENIELLRQRFTSTKDRGDGPGDGFEGFGDDGVDGEGGDANDEEVEGWGDFEDLEAGENEAKQPEQAESLEAERAKNAARKEELKQRFEEEDREGFGKEQPQQEFGEDDWYESQKANLQKQIDINKAEFEGLDERQRLAVEGLGAGKYVSVILEKVPAEFVVNFSAREPLIIGTLSPLEERFGFLQVRMRKHRWHKKILKNNDPLIFSAGWRRFQAMPMLHSWEERVRHRMLKYSPEHSFCYATFWGPFVSPNTSFTCFQSLSSENPGFRVAATGTILSVDQSYEIVKKLKLTGVPAKVYKNTAFIKDMFNTSLEIAKFEGASIKTVSGIRGQIKRALSKPEGHFRATFEDKILMGDLVFLRAWYPIKPHRFYNPVTERLGDWQPMRLTGQVRRDENLPTPQNADSKYRPVERAARHFNPLRVPRALAAELPFKSQIVRAKPQRHQTYAQKRAVVLGGEEKKARDLMQKLTTVRKDTLAKRRAKKEEKRAEFRKKTAAATEKREAREKREKQEFWQREGKKRKNDGEGGRGGGGGGKRRK